MSFVGHQIGQCRVYVEREMTVAHYAKLAVLSTTCSTTECHYFENTVVNKDIRFWTMLRSMRIDLKKVQGPDGGSLLCMSATEKYKHAYQGRYLAFGRIGKTQHTPQTLDDKGQVATVDFFEPEADANVRYQIRMEADEMISFNFFLECERR